jgi:hypothetical protein
MDCRKPFISLQIATMACDRQRPSWLSLAMLGHLFRYGRLSYHGAFINLTTGRANQRTSAFQGLNYFRGSSSDLLRRLFSNDRRNLHHGTLSVSGLHFTGFLRDAHARLDRRNGVANRCFWCSFWILLGHNHLDYIDLDV